MTLLVTASCCLNVAAWISTTRAEPFIQLCAFDLRVLNASEHGHEVGNILKVSNVYSSIR